MFEGFPTYDRYRTLRLTSPMLKGADVFALQTALLECGFDAGVPDGILGQKTSAAIFEAQKALDGFMGLSLAVDGLAGGRTQEALVRFLIREITREMDLAPGALRGQIEHESGFRVGNYSPARSDGSYDAGVAQRNTAFTPPEQGFDASASLYALGRHVKAYARLYSGVADEKRRWALAQGSWNAPAYAAWFAQDAGATVPNSPPSWWPAGVTYVGKSRLRPGADATTKLNAYIASVSAYLAL
jgi:peptidoglycan hydrolase-like protein with peptidoglycan-binding domain